MSTHLALDASARCNIDDLVSEGIRFARAALLQIGRYILPQYDQVRQDVINRISESSKKLTRVEIRHQQFSQNIEDVAQIIPVNNIVSQSEIVKACAYIETMSGDYFISEIPDEPICSAQSYIFVGSCCSILFIMEIQPDSSGNESVVDIDSESTTVIVTSDPLTLRSIKNPVCNQVCGHPYDKETILNYIKAKNKGLLCPYARCPNLELRKEHLESNRQLIAKVAEKQT